MHAVSSKQRQLQGIYYESGLFMQRTKIKKDVTFVHIACRAIWKKEENV